MGDRLKIFLARARLDDAAAVKSLLLPIEENGKLAKMLSAHQSGFSYAYYEDARIGCFIASNGVSAMSFRVAGVSRREAASIAAECEQIAVWDMHEIRKAADRALARLDPRSAIP